MRDLTGKVISESEVTDMIKAVLKPTCKLWRIPAGVYRVSDRAGTRFIQVAEKGYPDLAGFRKADGKAVYIEVKREDGRMRKEQKDFEELLTKYDVLYGVARSPEDAQLIVRGEWDSSWNEKGRNK